MSEEGADRKGGRLRKVDADGGDVQLEAKMVMQLRAAAASRRRGHTAAAKRLESLSQLDEFKAMGARAGGRHLGHLLELPAVPERARRPARASRGPLQKLWQYVGVMFTGCMGEQAADQSLGCR